MSRVKVKAGVITTPIVTRARMGGGLAGRQERITNRLRLGHSHGLPGRVQHLAARTRADRIL